VREKVGVGLEYNTGHRSRGIKGEVMCRDLR
jgi:hypothetical protein